MTDTEQSQLDRQCRAIYDQIDGVWRAHEGKFPTWELGYALLFSPPRHKPALVVLGHNPSAFFGTPYPQCYDPLWPPSNELVTESYPFAAKMQRLFAGVDALGALANSVHMNLNAFRSRPVSAKEKGYRWRDNPCAIRQKLEQASHLAATAMLDLMQPKVVLATGMDVFDRLTPFGKDVVPRRGSQRRCVASTSGKHKVIGIPHPTGAYVSNEDWDAIMQAVRAAFA